MGTQSKKFCESVKQFISENLFQIHILKDNFNPKWQHNQMLMNYLT